MGKFGMSYHAFQEFNSHPSFILLLVFFNYTQAVSCLIFVLFITYLKDRKLSLI